ncbi:MAG: hypothetical protein O7C56_06075, partial [Rickettsia endosymbiont of Ixodes persulcatus]|nr:hypothetical protein [Rickettsia endosymbiont of Ixodes persulcatus]
MIRTFSCTFVETPQRSSAIGTANETGHYNGVIGLIQRDEADVSLVNIALDDLLSDTVLPGPATNAKDGVILTQYRPQLTIPLDLLDSVRNFSDGLWCFYFISCLLIIAILVCIGIKFQSLDLKTIVSSVYSHSWNVNMAFFDQVEYSPSDIKRRILWFMFCVFLFFTFETFGAMMSSDIAVKNPVRQVETLEDVATMDDVKPRFFPQMSSIDAFSHSPENSTSVYRRIYNKAKTADDNGDRSIMLIDTSHVEAALGLADTMYDHSAVLVTSYVVKFLQAGVCSLTPKLQ